jgi:hypothetical protein
MISSNCNADRYEKININKIRQLSTAQNIRLKSNGKISKLENIDMS